jgi:DNA-binding CsgD family transcriptional regulator
MAFAPQALSDREKAVLRLLFQGYDAKSSARQLGISVHAVNERLRTARRKLGVSSSREAARLLARSETQGSNSFVDKKIGVAISERDGEAATKDIKGDRRTFALAVGGVCTVALVILIAILATTSSRTAASGPLPNWSLQAALPGKSLQQSNRIYLTGNRLLWNGDEVSEENVRNFLTVETQMSPQPLTILTYGSKVPPGRIQRTRQLIEGVLHCKPATCLEVTTPVDEDGTGPGRSEAPVR